MDKKKAILETTLKLITEKGVQSTAMSLVAKEAGVAIGTIYHYFDSKDSLLNELYLDIKKVFGDIIGANVNCGATYKERFTAIWKAVYFYYINNPYAFNFIAQLAHSPLISKDIKEKGAEYYFPIIGFFQEGIEFKHIKPFDLHLLAELLYGAVATTVSLYLSGDLLIDNDALEQAIEYSWRGIAF